MANNNFAPDYVDVATRIGEFREKHPEGSYQVRLIELPAAFAGNFVAVEASVYRTPDDPRPGVEIAWEPVPGKTSFTRDSELQNAATSAIGRAIVAALAADTKRGIATAEDVRNRQSVPPPAPRRERQQPAQRDLEAESGKLLKDQGLDWWVDLGDLMKAEGVKSTTIAAVTGRPFTSDNVRAWLDEGGLTVRDLIDMAKGAVPA